MTSYDINVEELIAENKKLTEALREHVAALTGLSLGGSENFSKRIGDVYLADIPFCTQRIKERMGYKLEQMKAEAENESNKKQALENGLELCRQRSLRQKAEEEIVYLREVISTTRELVKDAAMTGFNCHDGDWAERLFFNQQALSKALNG